MPRVHCRRRHAPAGESGGYTLIETVISVAVMLPALLAFAHATVTSIRTTAATRETSVATEASRQILEDLLATDFEDVFALFNTDPDDDPDGPGSARGATFDVEGLTPVPGDPDGAVGEIVFPAVGGTLREDTVSAALGMPRDLNRDDVIDALDHSGDYQLLPVLVRVRWRAASGDSEVVFRTVLGRTP